VTIAFTQRSSVPAHLDRLTGRDAEGASLLAAVRRQRLGDAERGAISGAQGTDFRLSTIPTTDRRMVLDG
jgi:hypothetical protein